MRDYLLASTSEVYGDPEVHPQPESYRGCVNTIGVRSCYDEGKRIAETLCFDYQRMHSTEIRIARIFNTYGPRMLEDDGRVVSNFIIQALRNQPLTLYGGGQQTRSFCYVDDLVEGLLKLMEGDQTGPINLGNPDEFTIRQLAEKIKSKINPSLTCIEKPLPKMIHCNDSRKSDLAQEKARMESFYRTRLKGLKKTIDDFRKRVEEEN